VLHKRVLSRTFSAIRRDGYDDELVAKMVSDGATWSIWPHSGILISSFSGADSMTSHAPSNASSSESVAVATPNSPKPLFSNSFGSASVTY
jgi:hypothetical protein